MILNHKKEKKRLRKVPNHILQKLCFWLRKQLNETVEVFGEKQIQSRERQEQAVCLGNERPRDTQTTRRWWGWETRERNATLVHPSIASLVLTNFVSHASLSSSESTVYTSQALNSQEGKLHPRKIKHLTFHNIYYKRQTAESLV